MAGEVTVALSILRRRQVESLTGLPTSTIYSEMARGAFPRPLQLAAKSVGWRSDEVQQWIETRTRAGQRDLQECGQ